MISGWPIWRAKSDRWFFTGWFWFAGSLVPTLGLVQVGPQAMADRYMYVRASVICAFGVGLSRFIQTAASGSI